ncbi:MAG: hypothetical protein AAF945_06830 [Actinomycetota bacterium]
MAASENPDVQSVPVVDRVVAQRIVAELGDRAGGRVLKCLGTAAQLIRLSAEDDEFRFAESAAYNVREALDSVVRDRPGAEGGLRTALGAWERYKLVCEQPGADEPAARAELGSKLDGLARDGHRQAFMTRKLLDWFRQRTGVGPLEGEDDPTAQYQRVRDTSQAVLHADASAAEVRTLYVDTVAWFTRLFAPPSDIARRLGELAALPFTIERLGELRSLALNGNHVRLFLERLADPAWLEPMRRAGLIGLPVAGEPWPVAALTTDDRRVADEVVTEVLDQAVKELVSLPKEQRPVAAFEIARTACWLGRAGYPVVAELARQFPADHGVRVLAGTASKELDASDRAQVVIADALIGNEPRHEGGHLTQRLIARLIDGLTPANLDERFELIALKLRRLANEERFLALDIAALSIEADDRSEMVLNVACLLSRAIPRARELGLATPRMLDLVGMLEGELGQRMVCQVLAGATDVERRAKLLHLAERLASETATGDDRVLIDDLAPLAGEETELLRAAFGVPPAAPVDPDGVGRDSARAWRWSMLLPPSVLAGWEEAIDAVTLVHGPPDVGALDRRMPMSGAMVGSSPISRDELAALAPLDAASRAARWRPTADDPWGVSARELGRTIQVLASERPEDWAEDPVAIVTAMREPVYVDHYLRALQTNAARIVDRAPAVIAAITLVTTERWDPTPIGRDGFEFEDSWSQVDVSAVELIDALADADAELNDDLAGCWKLALELASDRPDDVRPADQYLDSEGHDDPLHHAINSRHGRGLQAAIALGGWEFRRTGAASERLKTMLTAVLSVDGAVGLQLRAVIAASRPFIEAIASAWLDQHDARLFDDALGPVTFDQTVKYSRPTPILFERSLDRLLGAARRGTHNAVAWLLIAYLWEVPGYSFDSIIEGLKGDERALTEAASEIARLSLDISAEQSEIAERGVTFWTKLLDRAGDGVPGDALVGSGRWALEGHSVPIRWLELTERTVEITDGVIDCAWEVAQRCRDLQPEPAGLRILAAIARHGEPWERQHIEEIGVEALRAASAAGLNDDSFHTLRELLVQRGRHDAAEVTPPD